MLGEDQGSLYLPHLHRRLHRTLSKRHWPWATKQHSLPIPQQNCDGYPVRAQIVKDIQAKADAERHDILQIDNKSLRERVEALEKEKQIPEYELARKVTAENEKLRRELTEP